MRLMALGDLNLDLLCYLDHWPAPGEDVLAQAIDTKVGGSAANTAAALAACGASASMVARVGRDVLAHVVVSELEKLNVDVSRIQRGARDKTGLTFITVDPAGERTMFAHRGANTELDPEHIRPEWFSDIQLLHLSGYALLRGAQRAAALRALQLARDGAVAVSLDIGRAAACTCAAVLDRVDILLASMPELPDLCDLSEPDAAVRCLLAMGPKVVVIKLAAKGALVGTQEGLVEAPAARVQVSDTTGAGDLFNAGFLFGYLSRLPLKTCGVLGNALAALGIATNGPGRPLPAGPALVTWMEELVLPSMPGDLIPHLQTACQTLATVVH
jgi:ribokinase